MDRQGMHVSQNHDQHRRRTRRRPKTSTSMGQLLYPAQQQQQQQQKIHPAAPPPQQQHFGGGGYAYFLPADQRDGGGGMMLLPGSYSSSSFSINKKASTTTSSSSTGTSSSTASMQQQQQQQQQHRHSLSMDEAFRRVGHKLSQRVLADAPPPRGSDVRSLHSHPRSAFSSVVPSPPFLRHQQQHFNNYYNEGTRGNNNNNNDNSSEEGEDSTVGMDAEVLQDDDDEQKNEQVFDRTFKVAKMGYADHGSHAQRSSPPRRESVLKKLTQRARETYERAARRTPQDFFHTKKRTPPSSSTASSGGSSSATTQPHQNYAVQQPQEDATTTAVSPHRQALSQLVLEDDDNDNDAIMSGATTSTTRTSPQHRERSHNKPQQDSSLQVARPHQTETASSTMPPPSGISNQHNTGLLDAALKQPPEKTRDSCLTHPSEPVSNDGLDNVEGNLIVHRGDVLTIPPSTMHTFAGSPSRHQFTIFGALGQGTFAQVFLSRCESTAELVALKIVKNKPAYTRQAAVEIDVFKTLRDSHVLERNHMVQLQCYFFYKSHLCLVFELLGLNLYEVLKKRQFRGLPLNTVRSLIQQAMEGVKDLSQKSIVHCDLKPENILLCSEEDVAAVVHVGERVVLSSSDHKKIAATDVTTMVGGELKAETPLTDDTGRTSSEASSLATTQSIKLIDFGSACFEGHTAHTYIQSRFYRSPEVLIGLPYDSAIDMWSLGCVAAELFLGLPILPGVHEHDQLGRISEMIGPIPDWMLEQGTKSTKYFVKQFVRSSEDVLSKPHSTAAEDSARTPSPAVGTSGSPPPAKISWRLKTLKEYIHSLSSSELKKKGGLAKLEKQPANRYFKRKRLADIIMLHGQSTSKEDKEALGLFVHFLLGTLDPDPWKRLTAYQASMHPFITGSVSHRRRKGINDVLSADGEKRASESQSREFDIYWAPPWDPSICRRKLLNVQKMREKQQEMRRSFSGQTRSPGGEKGELSPHRHFQAPTRPMEQMSHGVSDGVAASDAALLRRQRSLPMNRTGRVSPPAVAATTHTVATGNLSLPQQNMGVGMINGAAESVGAMVMNNMPVYVAGSSLTDPRGFESQFPFVYVATNPGYEVQMGQPMQVFSGAQSFTGMSIDSLQQTPSEGDFAYALQRPGVFPGIGGDVSGSFTMGQPMNAMAYPPQFLSSGGQLGNFAYPSNAGYVPTPGRRRHTYTHGVQQASSWNNQQSSFVPGGFLTSPTSIREDATDVVNLGGPSDASSLQTSSSTTSLLAQQLEANASLPMSQDSSMQERMHTSDNQLQANPPQFVGPGAGSMMYTPQSASFGAGLHPGYTVAGMDVRTGIAMSHGSFTDPQHMVYYQYGPTPNSLPPHQPSAYPSHLVQPSLEEMEQTGGNGHPGATNRRFPRARPPPRHQRQSM